MSAADAEVRFDVAFFPKLTATRPQRRTMTWAELLSKLSRHVERPMKDGPGWSPAEYLPDPKNPRSARITRANHNVLNVTQLVLDYDGTELPLEALEPFEYLAHTTYSHTAEKPCWRVILPLRTPCPSREWAEAWLRARHLLGSGMDESAKDPSRFYYLPTAQPGHEREVRHHRGELLDWTALPAVPEAPKTQPKTLRATDTGNNGERVGDRFMAATDWPEILERHGFRIQRTLSGNKCYWRCPGTQRPANEHCATTGGGNEDVLYIFCAAERVPFESRTSYTKFAAYALLNHDGDYVAAVRDLSARGFGDPEPKSPVIVSPRAAVVAPAAGECTEAVAERDARIAQLETQLAERNQTIGIQMARIQEQDARIAYLQQREQDTHAIIANEKLQGNAARAELGLLWSTDSSLQEGNPQPTRIHPPTFAKLTGMSESAASDQIKRIADGTRWKRELRSVRMDVIDPETGKQVIDPVTGEVEQRTVRQTWVTRVAPTAAEAFRAATTAVPLKTTPPWGGSRVKRCPEHPGAPVNIHHVVTCTVCDARVDDYTTADPPERKEHLARAGGRKQHLARVKYLQSPEGVEDRKRQDAVCTPPAGGPTPIRIPYTGPANRRYKRCLYSGCHIPLRPEEFLEGYCASHAIDRALASSPPIDDDPARWAALGVAGGVS